MKENERKRAREKRRKIEKDRQRIRLFARHVPVVISFHLQNGAALVALEEEDTRRIVKKCEPKPTNQPTNQPTNEQKNGKKKVKTHRPTSRNRTTEHGNGVE